MREEFSFLLEIPVVSANREENELRRAHSRKQPGKKTELDYESSTLCNKYESESLFFSDIIPLLSTEGCLTPMLLIDKDMIKG